MHPRNFRGYKSTRRIGKLKIRTDRMSQTKTPQLLFRIPGRGEGAVVRALPPTTSATGTSTSTMTTPVNIPVPNLHTLVAISEQRKAEFKNVTQTPPQEKVAPPEVPTTPTEPITFSAPVRAQNYEGIPVGFDMSDILWFHAPWPGALLARVKNGKNAGRPYWSLPDGRGGFVSLDADGRRVFQWADVPEVTFPRVMETDKSQATLENAKKELLTSVSTINQHATTMNSLIEVVKNLVKQHSEHADYMDKFAEGMNASVIQMLSDQATKTEQDMARIREMIQKVMEHQTTKDANVNAMVASALASQDASMDENDEEADAQAALQAMGTSKPRAAKRRRLDNKDKARA